MAEIKLTAITGRGRGNGPARRLRAEGKIPGVVYGLDKDPLPIAVEWRPLRAALTTDAGTNVLLDLEVDGDVDLAIVKDLQRHPIRGDVLHIDFLRVDADAEIVVEVPIVLEGEARLILNEGGTVDQSLFTLAVSAKPSDIPNEIVVDISEMDFDTPVRIEDLALPAGVSTDLDPEETVASGVYGITEEELEALETTDVDTEVAEDAAEADEAPGDDAEGESEEG